MTDTRGFPPRHSWAASWSAWRWCSTSQSREKLLGAPIWIWSPSTATRRLGRTQVSSAASGILGSSAASRRAQRLSSMTVLPNRDGGTTYAHSYPQVWITPEPRERERTVGRTTTHREKRPPRDPVKRNDSEETISAVPRAMFKDRRRKSQGTIPRERNRRQESFLDWRDPRHLD